MEEQKQSTVIDTGLHVELRCSNQLALLTTEDENEGSRTRTVYVVASHQHQTTDNADKKDKTVTLIEGLQFHLYVAVPAELDPHLLHEEMVLSYARWAYGKGAIKNMKRELMARAQELEALNKTRKEMEERLTILSKKPSDNVVDEQGTVARWEEQKKLLRRQELRVENKRLELRVTAAKLVTLRNKKLLLEQYRRMLHCIDPQTDQPLVPQLPPGPAKLAWMKRVMPEWHGFACVTEHRAYDIAEKASLCRSKLRGAKTWRFTFENHQALPHFVRQFANPFEVGVSYDEERNKVPGVLHQIWVLQDGGRDPSLFAQAKDDHGLHKHLLGQTLLFTQDDYVYKWHWATDKVSQLKAGCLEPPFPSKTTGNNNVVMDARGLGDGDDDGDIITFMNDQCVPVKMSESLGGATNQKTRRVSHNTVTFSLTELGSTARISLVHMRDKQASISLHVGSIEKKKRPVEEDTTTPNTELVKEPVIDAWAEDRSARLLAVPKMSNLPGQKKPKQQGTLMFTINKKES